MPAGRWTVLVLTLVLPRWPPGHHSVASACRKRSRASSSSSPTASNPASSRARAGSSMAASSPGSPANRRSAGRGDSLLVGDGLVVDRLHRADHLLQAEALVDQLASRGAQPSSLVV